MIFSLGRNFVCVMPSLDWCVRWQNQRLVSGMGEMQGMNVRFDSLRPFSSRSEIRGICERPVHATEHSNVISKILFLSSRPVKVVISDIQSLDNCSSHVLVMK